MSPSSVPLFCLLTLVAQSLPGQDWTTQLIDSPAEKPALTLDSQGRVHISYMVPPEPGDQSYRVKHAVRDEGGFVLTNVDSGFFNSFTAIAIDQQDNPHITNHSHEDWAFRHHYWDGIAWATEVVDQIPYRPGNGGHEGWSTSIIFDHDNHAQVSHIDYPAGAIGNSQGIIYVYNDGNEWTTDTTMETNSTWTFDGTSIGVDSQNNPSIAYHDSVTRNLMLAEKQIEGWILTEIDTMGDVGQYPDLKFDADDLPRIGYFKRLGPESGIVRLATFNGANWMIQDVDTLYNIPSGDGRRSQHMISLDISSSGDSHIAYSDEVTLLYATSRDSFAEKVIVAEYVDPDSSLEGSVWLDLDLNDIPHIAYSLVLAEGEPVSYYATQSSDDGAMCTDISAFQSACINGHLKMRVVFGETAQWAGSEIAFIVDSADTLTTTIIGHPSGTRARASLIMAASPGLHTVELAIPDCGLGVLTVDCSTSEALAEGEWEETDELVGIRDGEFMDSGGRTHVSEEMSGRTVLIGNHPNPFNPSTTIDYTLSGSSYVRLEVFNTLGERVRVLRDGTVQEAGSHSVVFDAQGLPSGIYFYRLQAGDFVETRKLVLMR